MMWRKHYRSMYEGSMFGSGAVVFAVMGYVITHQEHARGIGWVVRLNPALLGAIIGEEPGVVKEAIEFLCQADKDSTSRLEEGRRLVMIAEGTMEYRVVNGDKYQEAREYDDRLEQNRLAQARWRAKQLVPSSESVEEKLLKHAGFKGREDGVSSRFKAPTQEECRLWAVEIGLGEGEGNAFWHFYESKGWKVGKSGMKNWKAAMSGWKNRRDQNLGGGGEPGPVVEVKPKLSDAEMEKRIKETVAHMLAKKGTESNEEMQDLREGTGFEG